MGALTYIEDLLLGRARDLLGERVRTYAPLPGGVAQLGAVLGTALAQPPAVLSAWRGSAPHQPSTWLRVRSEWSLLAIASAPAGETVRRRGDAAARIVGAWELAERLARALHDVTLPDIGTLAVVALGPVDGERLLELGLAVAEVRVRIAHDLTAGPGIDAEGADGMDDFLTFAADYDLAPADGAVEASDTVTLPQT